MAFPVLFPGDMTTNARILLIATLLSSPLAGCDTPGVKLNPVGYWEGSGTAIEMLDAHSRHFARGAKYDFWFDIDQTGTVKGEAQIDYDANLSVDLPSANMMFVSINPSVNGSISAIGSHRKLEIVGAVKEDLLSIEPVLDDAKPLTFTISANPGINMAASENSGAMGHGLSRPGKMNINLDMKPFDPFSTAKESGAEIAQHGNGPWSASFDAETDTYALHWRARQVAPDERSLDMTPKMKTALNALRARLGS